LNSIKLVALSAILFFSSLQALADSPKVKEVESGLRGAVRIDGDPAWNIEDRMQYYGVPGVSIAVIKDYKIHWVKHYGVTDKETGNKVNQHTLFQAGSISKPVAAYAALKLVEDKRLSLDAPVNEQLGDWKLPENKFTRTKPVALKHLLNHSAGITVHGFPGYAEGEKLPSIDQVLDGLKPANTGEIRVNMQPETQFRYSGGGYTVMQKLVSDVAKTNYPEIMNELVLAPLSMSQSTFEQPLPTEKLKYAAAGYLPNKLPVPGKRHVYPEMAAAGLWTTAEDLAKFAIDVQLAIKNDNSKILSQSMANKMLTPFVSDNTGLGFFIEKHNQDIYFGHAGWDEGFSADLMAHKTKGYGVVIMTNSNHPGFINELKNSVAAVYQWDNFLPPNITALPISADEQKRIAGRYRFNIDMMFTIFSENNRVFMQYLDDKKMEVFRIGENQFIRREHDMKFRFEKLKDDNSVSLVFGVDGETEYVRKRLSISEEIPFESVIKGQLKKAERMYVDLLRKSPIYKEDAEWVLLGYADKLIANNNSESALKIYKMCTRLFLTARSYVKLANYYKRIDDKKNALASLKKAQVIEPENPVVVKALKNMKG
jgi:CubicO group peptidase (beta-lactamase class C family)